MYFRDEANRACAVVVFATYRYYVDSSDSMKLKFGDCHFCGATLGVALFSKDSVSGDWDLYNFDKFFSSSGLFGGAGVGGIGDLSLVTIGDHWTALLLKQPVGGNMGEAQGAADLYSLEEFQLDGFPNHSLADIFSYVYHQEEDDERSGKLKLLENSEMTPVQKTGGYYGLRLTTTTNGKKKVRDYHYSDEGGAYEQLTTPRR